MFLVFLFFAIVCYSLLFFHFFYVASCFPIFLIVPYVGFGCGGIPNLYTKISNMYSINICFFSVYIVFIKYTRHE